MTKEEKKNRKLEEEKKCMEIIDKFFDMSMENGSFYNSRWTKEMIEPKSYATGKDYKGYNVLYLATKMMMNDLKDNRFMTIDKLNDINEGRGKNEKLFIKKGEKGTLIKYLNIVDSEDYYRKKLLKVKSEDEREKIEKKIKEISERNKSDSAVKRETLVFTGYHTVFSAEQIKDFEKFDPLPEKEQTNKDINKDAYISYLIKGVIETSEIGIETKSHYMVVSPEMFGFETNGAYNQKGYSRNKETGKMERVSNVIVMPPRKDFKSDKLYLASLLHERTHSISDDDRKKTTEEKFKMNRNQAYAYEEVVAELTAGMTLTRLGVELKSDNMEENVFGTNKAYIQNYIKDLKEMPKLQNIFETFSAESIKRSDILLDKLKEYEKEYPFEKFLEDELEKGKLENGELEKELLEKTEVTKNSETTPKEIIKNEKEEYFIIPNKKLENFIKDNSFVNIETIDSSYGKDLTGYAKIQMINDIEKEKETFNMNKIEDEDVNKICKDLKKGILLSNKKERKNSLILTEDSIEKLVKTVKEYNEEKNKSMTPTLTISTDQIIDFAKSVKEEITDFEVENDYENFEEEYSDLFEEKAIKMIAGLTLTNKSFDEVEREIDTTHRKYENVKISGTQNMLGIEKTAKDLNLILNAVKKYDFDKTNDIVKKIGNDEFSAKILTSIKTENEKLEEIIEQKDFYTVVDYMSEKRESLNEKISNYMEKIREDNINKLLEKTGIIYEKNDKKEIEEKEIEM